MKDVIIYQDSTHDPYYGPASVAKQSPPADARKIVAYSGGVLYALDHRQGTKIDFPVSRWKLAEIGLSCIMAAFSR